jgi:ABC-type sugar transport system ATPase subunit
MILLDNLTVCSGPFRLEGLSFAVPTGQYAVLMGRTGSGKTTILETLCGLKPALGGQIVLDGRDVTALKPGDRGIGYVPQDGALFQTMTVREHLELALVVRKWPRKAIVERVDELAALLGIDSLLGRKPFGLSGGEGQRVSLGRALSCQPSVLLLDEPLSALDEETKDGMYALLKSVQERTGVTAIHVTHSMTEANRLADRLLLLKEGGVSEEIPNPKNQIPNKSQTPMPNDPNVPSDFQFES